MHSTRQLRPARTHRRARADAAVAFGAALGIVVLAGITAASATADVGTADQRTPAMVTVLSSAAIPGAEPIHAITADATATLDAARAALADATQVVADVAASELDLGAGSTTIDVARIRESITRLEPLDALPLLFLPGMTDDAAVETERVAAQTAALRDRLDAAIAKKAAEEAAAQAAAAANTPDGAKATARQLGAERGWGGDQFSCLDALWNRESNWNYQAANSSSGAFGIPQALPGSKMASAGADWQTNAATQVRWGLDYIARAYGTPCNAWSHSQATGWY